MTGALGSDLADDGAESDAALFEIPLEAGFFEPEDNGIWVQNLPALNAFLMVCTQWRLNMRPDGKQVAIGLDYAGAKSGLELAGVAVDPKIWADLRVIERGAMDAINEDLK